ncbi:hypothetical protein A3K29_04965 [Candidatus Collierbacteria bacterium RIFOXYB2_FULL_46_14]|uniref:O-antigen ligase-related domain-containing protein n=1 Tax=Candidatus Collierbacteria bacterium GW2011_GWA2_46_26 TaxID=1618381 RepID=A0A0G1PJZ5_9BACT|nr:MAG: hypothetical protein UX47_C0006G0042 [Candidatus Collierbacteria bacterium GW2011_GWA2_46_26]OGD73447.1 MAG: hypothetical protein A3K29_04965 [Candidatus Collierbacteria bacterium RIFOXYB2_FULL_46_14]OGD76489.1 MAG: hypothetical protein A3K43_04965 [Candidatus Collierbacteria bacterium RIFOXYA2_FULL_46_20]OGD77825.1 MAG: hypothetical protein A3K39_04965 [Candidatus Collierbacteria bacterium RIFOXYC2_FULL_43_15]OGD81116.1 MAG: hypothetical protein A2320_05465 [Pseudomonadales bacterium G
MSSKEKAVIAAAPKPATFIQYCFYTLFFVTPLLLWPFTSEVFEFNKMMFVYAMTIVITAAWGIRSFQNKRFEIVQTPLDLPIILFLSSQVISTMVSIDRHTSLWGYYSRFHGGLVSTICYIVLFYALVTHFSGHVKAINNLKTTILATAALTAFYAVLEKMGIDKNIWVQDVQSRVFSTLGQPNWLSAYLIALLPLSLFTLIRTDKTVVRLIHSALSLLFLAAILFTRSQSGIGATAIILLIFVITVILQKKQPKLLIGLAVLILALLFVKGEAVQRTLGSLNKINPFYSNSVAIITEENKTRVGGSDSMSIRRVVWQGAIELGKKYPFFGTGVETFGYSYYWVRPSVHNLTSESDFLYNKAHNEYLNFLANTGFFGLLAYLFLVFSILKILTDKSEVSQPLLLGFISILITNYFGFSVVNVALFFFLFPAIFLATTDKTKTHSRPISLDTTIGTVLIVIVALWLLLGVRRMWMADLAYTAGRSNLTKDLNAIKLNSREPMYYAQLGNVQALVATQIISPQIAEMSASTPADIRQKANYYLQQYISDAVANTNKAVSMNKYNLNLFKTKARTELILGTLDPKYNLEAAQTLLKISELSPTDAANYLNIGILYSQLNQNDEAKLAFQKAIELKPDYEAAKDRLSALK